MMMKSRCYKYRSRLTTTLIAVLFLLTGGHLIGQVGCEYPIKWTELDLTIYPDTVPYIDSIKSDSGVVVIEVVDCMGEGSFKYFNENGELKVEGSFLNSLGLLGHHAYYMDVIEWKPLTTLRQYYEGLPDGTWVFFKEDEEIRVEYDKGVKLVK